MLYILHIEQNKKNITNLTGYQYFVINVCCDNGFRKRFQLFK